MHVARALLADPRRGGAVPGGAVLVEGAAVAAVGPYEELAAAHPTARVRRWPGVITPGLWNPYGPELLQDTYHPDPREADALGTEPLTGPAGRAELDREPGRPAASARRCLQRMLAHGTVAVAGDLTVPAVAQAVRRAGLGLEERFAAPAGPPSLDPFAGRPPVDAFGPVPLGAAGVDADFAVFDVPVRDDPPDVSPDGAPDGSHPEDMADGLLAALAERGAGCCVATVLAGRLVHRRR
nr:hypothetical protein [Actinacidiphila yeochonensis]